ncbi:MAG TPA: alkaline phosphatase family protein [Thermoleophilaceae bacterium]|nr:alkaline phosphatase family protein [Thermoleophilaceae bacterium]
MGKCKSCGAPLAVDQRWCVECGTRRGPVSPAMQALIAPPHEMDVAVDPPSGGFGFPTPRAAAVAVTALLAAGVILGSVVSPAAESSAETPIVVAVSPPPAAPAPAPAPAPEEASVDDTPVTESAPIQTAPPQQQIIYQTVPQQTAPPTPPPALPIPPPPALPTISHVFVVTLTGHGFNAAFGPDSKATYLSKTLTTHGELIPNYYGIAHGELANEIALISGQGPTKATAANCPDYSDVTPGTAGDQGQATGDGCLYPADVKTLGDQLFAGGNTWKAYIEGAGAAGCDRATTNYKPFRNPFLNFHSLTDNAALCNPNVADLSQLQTDLQQVGDTPGLSYIVPSECHDGSDTPCAPDQPADQPVGLAAADEWLQTVIPAIEESPGFKQGGLIAITFDSAPKDGAEADSTACCGQPETYPNLPADDPSQQPSQPTASTSQFGGNGDTGSGTTTTPNDTTTTPTTTTPSPAPTTPPTRPSGGGGKVGLLLISPYIKPNTINDTGYYNHFSLFASIEDLFALGHIGYANLADLTVFDKSVYTAYTPGESTPPATGSRAKRKH